MINQSTVLLVFLPSTLLRVQTRRNVLADLSAVVSFDYVRVRIHYYHHLYTDIDSVYL